jgi:signal transduction histidine kinase
MTPEGDMLEINECGVALFEAEDVAHLKAMRLDDMILPKYRDGFAAMQARVMKGEPGRMEFEIEGLRGTRRWLESNATAMRDAETGSTVVLSICRDITAQKKATKALVRNQAIVRQISAALPFGFLVIDDRTNGVVHVNQQFCDLFGIPGMLGDIRSGYFSAKEVLERCSRIMLDAPGVAASCAALADVENRSVVSDEIACVDDRTIRRYSTQIRDDTDRYVARFYLFEDVSADRRAEQDRLRLESQLQQAMKMQSVGRLAGGVAHDFNNMLGVIIGHAEIAMRATSAIDPVHTDLVAIHKAAERSAALTRQLLAFASKQTAAPTRLDLNDTVGGSLRMLQRLISEDIRLSWRPQPALWPVRVDPS